MEVILLKMCWAVQWRSGSVCSLTLCVLEKLKHGCFASDATSLKVNCPRSKAAHRRIL